MTCTAGLLAVLTATKDNRTGDLSLYSCGSVILRLQPRGGGILGTVQDAAAMDVTQSAQSLARFARDEGWEVAS
jgi:hypothetical protein